MKQSKLLTLSMVFFAILSIILTYYLIIDFPAFQNFIWKEDYNQTVNNVSEKERVQETVFYQPTSLTLQDTLFPVQYIVRGENTTHQIIDKQAIKSFQEFLSNNPIEIKTSIPVKDQTFISSLYEQVHFQALFIEKTPIRLLSHYFRLPRNEESKFLVDRVIVTFDEANTGQVYLINSSDNQYLVGEIPKVKDLYKLAYRKNLDQVRVQGYIGKNGLIYLPQETMNVSSEVYTMENLPESLFVKSFFPNGDYKTNENTKNLSTYFNYQYTLEISDQKKLLNVRVNQPDKNDVTNNKDRFKGPFDIISKYEYWKNSIHLVKNTTKNIEFRRFINTRPIFMAPSMHEYAASHFNLSSDSQSDVYQFQLPLMIFHAHIPDQSEEMTVPSASEMVAMLENYGFNIRGFDSIILCYEWQEETEKNQKAILVPKWYFKINHEYYSWDQIGSQSFKLVWDRQFEEGE